jgi:flavorubredoxin
MSHFALDFSIPVPRQLPLEVANGTFVIRALTPSIGGTWTNLNAMVIHGAEPVVIDTGMATTRDLWFEDLFSLVSPDALRWIFVTHNDSDHSGNLLEALELCPNAQVVTSHAESFRTNGSFGVPFERIKLVEEEQDFQLGDRTFRAVRPPVYDSPYTRGLYDPATRVYYSSDAFCAPNPEVPVDWVDEIPEARWAEEFARFHHLSLCPWVAMSDPTMLRAEVGKLASLDIDIIVGAHSPAMRGASVAKAYEQMAALPGWRSAPN